MPWILGIDEAGYGPNLGPFVMTSVACRVPALHRRANLWDVLAAAARRPRDPACARIVVGDSKLVYNSAKGLAELERTVQATLRTPVATIADIVNQLCPDCHEAVCEEVWYTGATPLPVSAEAAACTLTAEAIGQLCADLEITLGPICSVVVCPAAFNALLDRWDTKGAVLATSLHRLLACLPDDDQDVTINIDKHGGRNTYAALLQPAFPDSLVLAREEGSLRSAYQVTDRGRSVEIAFEPRADGNHFCVALASMVSKYLREVLMLEFNRFWQARVPGLKATAGYPLDAVRFWQAIRPTVMELGLADDVLWRRK